MNHHRNFTPDEVETLEKFKRFFQIKTVQLPGLKRATCWSAMYGGQDRPKRVSYGKSEVEAILKFVLQEETIISLKPKRPHKGVSPQPEPEARPDESSPPPPAQTPLQPESCELSLPPISH